MANGEKGKGRSQNQRLKLFYLLDYLLEQTDETHTVKVQEIIEHFDNYYKIPVEQKTVCSDLRLLTEYGYGIMFDVCGWGEGAVYTIRAIPDPFKVFAIVEPGFDANTDFTKLRNFLYHFFEDEVFMAKRIGLLFSNPRLSIKRHNESSLFVIADHHTVMPMVIFFVSIRKFAPIHTGIFGECSSNRNRNI